MRTLIYKPGPWNGGRPFEYDHADPFALHTQLFGPFMRSRLGNCVSLPILFLILAERLALEMTLCQAPGHFFLRYTDERGRPINLEATSGALPARNEWMRQQMPMSDLALSNGLYMRPLGRREAVAAMATTVLICLCRERRYEEASEAAEVILRQFPRHVDALLTLGSAYGHFIGEFRRRYPSPSLIPEFLHRRHRHLIERNASLFAAAEALGWEPDQDGAQAAT